MRLMMVVSFVVTSCSRLDVLYDRSTVLRTPIKHWRIQEIVLGGKGVRGCAPSGGAEGRAPLGSAGWGEAVNYFTKYATDLHPIIRIGSSPGVDDCCETGVRYLQKRCHGNQFLSIQFTLFSSRYISETACDRHIVALEVE